MYNGGIFGGQGFGVPRGYGSLPDTNESIGAILRAKEREAAKASPTVKQESDKTKRMRNTFLSWFPRAKRSAFVFGEKGVSWGGGIIFPTGHRVGGPLIKDLGFGSGFPPALLTSTRGRYSHEAGSVKSFSTNITLYSSEENSFVINFRNPFTKQVLRFESAAECNKWKKGPNFKYWPQQLNLATWCATAGCGIAVDFEGLPKIVEGLLRFHIYFTIRRILYEMGCALPGDSGFNNINNPHKKAAVEAIKKEFGVAEGDFRWRGGSNGGLGDVSVHWSDIKDHPNDVIHLQYSDLPKGWPQSKYKFSDEYGVDDGHQIAYLENGSASNQAFRYLLQNSYGLTIAGSGRLNRSIEAFVYSVLGAQVNMRSSILGSGGIAQEVRQELTNLFEKAVIEEDLSDSVQRYQEAIENSHVKLDFAVSPGVWLLPGNLEINLKSKAGYNNFLQKATTDMTLGVNKVNEPGKSKNPSKQGTVPMTPSKPEEPFPTTKPEKPTTPSKPKEPFPTTGSSTKPEEPTTPSKPEVMYPTGEIHKDSLAAIAVVVGGATWWAFR